MRSIFGSRGERAEGVVEAYEFPASLSRATARVLDGADWEPVERSLRDWFICCANGRIRGLGMPSRVVQWVWEVFSVDEAAYDAFCRQLGGRPDPARTLATSGEWRPLARTVRAWDRSVAGRERDTPLWSLDEQLQIDNPIGIGAEAIAQLRSNEDARYGGAFGYGGGAGGGM